MACLLLGGLQTKDARHSMRRWAIDANCLHLMAPLTLFKCEDVTPCWESSLRGVDGQQLQLAMGCFLVSVNVWIIALGGRGYNLVSRDLRGKKKDYRVPKTYHLYSIECGKMQHLIWPGRPAFWMREPIGKVSVSLQLPLEVPVAIETVSALRLALRTVHAQWLI